MTTSVALGAIALGLLIWLLSAWLLDRYENEGIFTLLFLTGLMLTAAGFFYFLPAQSDRWWRNAGNILLYICFLLGVNWGFYRWLHR